jgi:hypothetical protein
VDGAYRSRVDEGVLEVGIARQKLVAEEGRVRDIGVGGDVNLVWYRNMFELERLDVHDGNSRCAGVNREDE